MGADAPPPSSLGAELTGVQAPLLRRCCAAWTPFTWVPRHSSLTESALWYGGGGGDLYGHAGPRHRNGKHKSRRYLTGAWCLTGWVGGERSRRYPANMHSRCSELTELVEAGAQQ